MQAARASELGQLIRYAGGARRDLLEPDEVRVELADDGTDSLHVLPPVDADAAMDVVGGDDHRLTSSPRSPRPPRTGTQSSGNRQGRNPRLSRPASDAWQATSASRPARCAGSWLDPRRRRST